MKLKHIFETVNMGDEFVAVPVDDSTNALHGVLKLNKEGAEIFEMLKNETTEESIIKTLSEKYDNDRKNLTENVHTFIDTLRTNNLISE